MISLSFGLSSPTHCSLPSHFPFPCATLYHTTLHWYLEWVFKATLEKTNPVFFLVTFCMRTTGGYSSLLLLLLFFSLHLDKSHDKQPIISIGIIIKPMHFHIHHLWDKLHPLIPVDLSLSLFLCYTHTNTHSVLLCFVLLDSLLYCCCAFITLGLLVSVAC